MYETMTVYPGSWVFYITFIFFTAFAFLNMVIGIVVNVMEEEHTKAREEKQAQKEQLQNAKKEDQMQQILAELQQIKQQLNNK